MSGVISMWADSCEAMAVYQHEMDEEVNTTHVHMIMIGCKYKTPEALKREFYKLIETERKGNDLWSWTHKKAQNPDMTFMRYMSKGVLRPVFVKGFTPAEVEEQRALWVEYKKTPVVSSDPAPSSAKLTKFQIVKQVQEYFDNKAPKDLFGKPLPYDVSDEDILQCIRRKLIDNEQPLGLYKVMDLYDGYIMFSNKSKFIHNCLNVLEKRQPRI